MQAIEHTLGAVKAASLQELQDELASARQALAELEVAKLAELAADIHEAQSRIGYAAQDGAMEPRQRRPIRDNPQA